MSLFNIFTKISHSIFYILFSIPETVLQPAQLGVIPFSLKCCSTQKQLATTPLVGVTPFNLKCCSTASLPMLARYSGVTPFNLKCCSTSDGVLPRQLIDIWVPVPVICRPATRPWRYCNTVSAPRADGSSSNRNV